MNDEQCYVVAVEGLKQALASLQSVPDQDSKSMYETLRLTNEAAHAIYSMAHMRMMAEEKLRELETPTEEF
jgi:hypothetical protein